MGVATAYLEPEPVQALFLPDGAGVQVRPAAPRDESVIQAYIGGLSSKSRFDRFHGALNELPAAELHRMTHQVDARQQTLIAEALSDDDTAARMIGEARYAVMPDGRSCEFAVSVAEAWRRRTLGMQLLRNLAWRAKRFGVRYLVGDVLRTNAAMTALARKTGFRITAPIADDRLLRITKDLSLPDAGPACEASTAQSRSIAV